MNDFTKRYQTAVATAERILQDRLNDSDITGEDCFLIITNTGNHETIFSAIRMILLVENDLEALTRYSHHRIFRSTSYRDPMIAGIAQKLVEVRKNTPEENDLTEWAWLVYRQGGGISRDIFRLLRDENKRRDDPYLRALLSLVPLIYQHPVLSNHNKPVPKESFTAIFTPKMRLEDDPNRDSFFRFLSQK